MKVIDCQVGWLASSLMCYKILELGAGRTYSSAELKCQASLGQPSPGQATPHLASIHSPQEHIALAGMIQSFLMQNSFTTLTTFWIGMNDTIREGNYTWSDGSTVNYLGWGQSQPNNWRGQDCVEMRMDMGFLWNDISCGKQMPYICGVSRCKLTLHTRTQATTELMLKVQMESSWCSNTHQLCN